MAKKVSQDWQNEDRVGRLIARRKEVRGWLETRADEQESERPAGLTGLALSGGGIRSATFSLGVIQALAKSGRDALSNIDVMSTVSGGGYMGCFLRSLFVPDRARGIKPEVEAASFAKGDIELDLAEVATQHQFARTVLESGTELRDIEFEGEKRRNPLWWLREHSRYLAPNGATDYVYALSYLWRNWVALMYVFLLASFAISSSVIIAEALSGLGELLRDWVWYPLGSSPGTEIACGKCLPGSDRILPVSPIFALLLLPMAASVIVSIGYWMTQAMSSNEPNVPRQWKNLGKALAATAISGALITFLAWSNLLGLHPNAAILVWISTAGVVLMWLGALVALFVAAAYTYLRVALTGQLRTRLTHWLNNSNIFFFAIFGIAFVDSIGAGLAYWLKYHPDRTFGAVGAAVVPLIAYLIKKLPDWFGKPGKGTMTSLLGRFFNAIAFLAGCLLFGLLAIVAAAAVHLVAWDGRAWITEPDWPRLWLLFGSIWVLTILSGISNGFINLSSIHMLYSARLTRAYLGASNNKRLEEAANPSDGSRITENHKCDYIQPVLYSRADLPAPIHIINTTINETIDPNSQLVARDRKGDVLSLEPSGIWIGKKPVRWTEVGEPECAEQLSLGQWCAISGAAASSGMGRLTNLGLALAFTFANVRLGYWWWSPGVCATDKTARGKAPLLLSQYFGTFIYLFNEMTARYSRAYQRKYLTDGGHFENSGAYRLIERRVPLILLSDNGADPSYRFEDLENLVRKVRLDLGGEIEVLGGQALDEYLMEFGATDRGIFADGNHSADWREQYRDPESGRFVLVMRVTFPDERLHLIWIKPRVLPGMPADLIGYTASNPLFPQQPTSDQFFEEEQWESYRKLGEICMSRLLESCPGLLARRQ